AMVLAFIDVLCLFFFQAEDGIRDFHVTGVQTCALPICPASPGSIRPRAVSRRLRTVATGRGSVIAGIVAAASVRRPSAPLFRRRSEERRVGKECRFWWSPCKGKRKAE